MSELWCLICGICTPSLAAALRHNKTSRHYARCCIKRGKPLLVCHRCRKVVVVPIEQHLASTEHIRNDCAYLQQTSRDHAVMSIPALAPVRWMYHRRAHYISLNERALVDDGYVDIFHAAHMRMHKLFSPVPVVVEDHDAPPPPERVAPNAHQ